MTQRMYLILSLLVVAAGIIFAHHKPEVVIFLAAMTVLMAVGLIADKRESAKHESENV